ncbi:MAG TPA: carboxypeptidase regulatory-like domain-containing protein [Bryobacteraceae bacterium]|nr:carboxypeptidase regulatory-like domain-containing protein [Bryobacteraceae bacterium]
MSEHLQPGVHPDADSLSAFVEGVLPEHERAKCLAHFAECARCREIVFLAQDVPVAPAAPRPILIPVHRRWFQPVRLLAAAAVLCVVIFGAWLYLRNRTEAARRDVVAQVTQAPSSPQGNRVETPAPKPVIRKRVPPAVRPTPPPAPVTAPEPPRTVPSPLAVETARSSDQSKIQANALPAPKPPAIAVPTVTASAEASSGISGTVTDASGAVVPQATVQLRQLADNSTTNARADSSGQFKFMGLAPGQYELQIDVPGFRRTTQRVEVKPQQVAAVKAELQVGSTAETVEVTAAASTVQTSSAEISTKSRRKRAEPPEPRPLPSKLPAEIMVTRGKVMLAVDSSGGFFFSGNSGKGWKAVKSQWPGKIVHVVAPPELPQAGSAQFQLTTDSGSDWLSRDGRHWYAAPPEH